MGDNSATARLMRLLCPIILILFSTVDRLGAGGNAFGLGRINLELRPGSRSQHHSHLLLG